MWSGALRAHLWASVQNRFCEFQRLLSVFSHLQTDWNCNIDAIRKLVKENPQISTLEIDSTYDICSTTLVNEHLHLTKTFSVAVTCLYWPTKSSLCWKQKHLKHYHRRWNLNVLLRSGTKQQSQVWFIKDEEPLTKVMMSQTIGKKMVVSFFSRKDHIATIQVYSCYTVSSELYIKICLLVVFRHWKAQYPKFEV